MERWFTVFFFIFTVLNEYFLLSIHCSMISVYSFLIANFVFECSALMIIKGYAFLFIHLVVFLDLDFCRLVANLDSFD